MPCSAQSRNAPPQTAQVPSSSHAPRGTPAKRGSPPRRPSRNIPGHSTAKAAALWGNAKKPKQAHTAPSTTSQGRRNPRVT